MSPFSLLLRQLRLTRGLKQKELAERLGYEASYLCALETGAKGPPRKDFLARLARELSLSDAEIKQLQAATARSRRNIKLPAQAEERVYHLFHELEGQLDRLDETQLDLINIALKLSREVQPDDSIDGPAKALDREASNSPSETEAAMQK